MKHPLFHSLAKRSGFALVLVLSLLVLLVGLSVGFLMRTSTERSASSEYHASATARQLADTCVSLVQGQINLATSGTSNVAWASQPGMVRTFDASGSLLAAYKLYSAQQMVSSTIGISSGVSDDLPPSTWANEGGIWTDLNAPVSVTGTNHYPILNPGASAEGYSITSAPGATTNQPAPMPVRWLYVLKDGSMVAASGTGTIATIAGATAASGTNPIVGRIAFWTDDDTCKVNINTASEGTFWDTPRSMSTYDYNNLAKYQPAQKEFQRYAGHPATTSLTTVFPTLTAEQIYAIAPRVIGGGSLSGTAVASSALTPDSDRLYANVDELLFTKDRTDTSTVCPLTKDQVEQSKFFLTAHSRAPETNLFNLPRIAMWPIYKLGVTGTADSTHTTTFDRLIAFCSSTGTQGTTSWHPYIFQREKPDSMSNDIGLSRNVELYSYLQYLTRNPIPGFGGDFLSKYGDDRDQILTEIFDYVRGATNLQDTSQAGLTPYTTGTAFNGGAVPLGYGWVAPSQKVTTTGTTMGLGRNYTLSQLALAFICNAAPDDPTTSGTDESRGSNIAIGAGANTVLSGTALNSGEKYIQAIAIPEFFSPMQGFVCMVPSFQMTITGLDTLKINDQQIFPSVSSSYSFGAAGQGNNEVNRLGGCPGFRYFGFGGRGSPPRGNLPGDSGTVYPFIGTPVKIAAPSTGGNMAFSGGTITVSLYAGQTTPSSSTLMQTFTITFPAAPFPVPEIVPDGIAVAYAGSPTFGGQVNSACSWWSFSKVGCITPAVASSGPNGGTSGRLNFISHRVATAITTSTAGGQYFPGAFLRPEQDTIRAMLPAHGDFRLIAANPAVTGTSFGTHRNYGDTTQRMAASFASYGGQWNSNGTLLSFNDPNGKYISSATYGLYCNPDIPGNATGQNTPEGTGDYDTGLAVMGDGSFANKPDEGTTSDSAHVPYYDAIINGNNEVDVGPVFFSPNRQIPSPGVLGSLPTGVKANVPWRTLLFRPQSGHFGSSSPEDHLFLDLFWMPVVEPYAISDRFSTAGKINLNYQILPFTYIERSTGLRALFKAEKVAAVSTTSGTSYKTSNGHLTSEQYRFPIDEDQTLTQFKTRFDAGNVFKSASEICDIHIVPQISPATTVDKMADTSTSGFWHAHALTGDNWRERIYTTLYPRMTTKSNTYTVHFIAQALRSLPGSSAGTWTERRDVILAEYRGSTSIERFINANATIPNYAADPSSIGNADTPTLDKFYKWRIISNQQFAP